MLQMVERNVKVLLTTVKRLKPSEQSFISIFTGNEFSTSILWHILGLSREVTQYRSLLFFIDRLLALNLI